MIIFTAALKVPLSVITSHSTVGFPLESRIYLALMSLIVENPNEDFLDATLEIIFENILILDFLDFRLL
jgi:hypothetical protein